MKLLGAAVTCVLALGVSCTGNVEDPTGDGPGIEPEARYPFSAGLRTLTPSQYRASVQEVIGVDVPVEPVGQWPSAIAAARGGIAPATVLDYEESARLVAAWVFEDPARRDMVLGCEPVGDGTCEQEFLGRIGRRAFRRPLTTEEIDRYTSLSSDVTTLLGDPLDGAEHALSGLLQSPHFLYRAELGEPLPDDPTVLAYTDHELATRISYLLFNTTPDDELLDAAAAGQLRDPEGLRQTVDRMLADPRGREGLRQFFGDIFNAAAIEGLEKDPTLFPLATPEVLVAMRSQLVHTAEAAVFMGDYRNLFTTRTTFVNADLAPLYELPDGYGPEMTELVLAADDPRGGILTTPGFLAQHAYPGKTSPALRGLFVRKVLLCQDIPPPPAEVDTTLPEPAPGELVTTRELVAMHQTQPSCAGCHSLMDPIGLGLERFDAFGGFREFQNDLPIDPSGEIDGIAFDDARGLGEALADHPGLVPCLLEHLYAYASGRTVSETEVESLEAISTDVVDNDYRIDAALRGIATHDLFRFAEVSP